MSKSNSETNDCARELPRKTGGVRPLSLGANSLKPAQISHSEDSSGYTDTGFPTV
jgi:hypothetical protein